MEEWRRLYTVVLSQETVLWDNMCLLQSPHILGGKINLHALFLFSVRNMNMSISVPLAPRGVIVHPELPVSDSGRHDSQSYL